MRHASYVVLIALTAVALIAPTTGQAARHRSVDWQTGRALKIAEKMWGPAPCGTPQIIRAKWLPSFRESSAKAVADEDTCEIFLRPNWRPAGWGDYCTVLLHERGHLDGYRDESNTRDPWHSHDPNNLMAGDYMLQVNFVIRKSGRTVEAPQTGNRRCWHFGRGYLRS